MELSDKLCHSNVREYFRGRPAFLTEIGLGWVYIAAEETLMTNKEAITKFRKQLDDACVRHAYKKDTQLVALESITLEEARILRDECDKIPSPFLAESEKF
jgi:hypothetical protein